MMKRIILLLITINLAGFISCSDNTTDPELEENLSGPGEVTLEITGDFETEKKGTAMFWGAGESSFDNDYGSSWQILTSDESSNPFTFRLDFIFIYPDELVSRPEPGTYPIGEASFGDAESPVFSAVYVNVEESSSFLSFGAEMCGVEEEYSHTGEMVIESSTAENVTGSFEFEAYFCSGGNTDTVTINGEFTAPRADLID